MHMVVAGSPCKHRFTDILDHGADASNLRTAVRFTVSTAISTVTAHVSSKLFG